MNRYTHIGVYGLLLRDNHVLLIKKSRGPHTGKWDLPGGTIEFGEEPLVTLEREFFEETGLTQISGTINRASSYTLIYPYKDGELEELHHIGIIYDVELQGASIEVKSEEDGEDSFGASWLPLDEIPNMEVTPFVQEILCRK
ncbi:NUDIX hydrolase [Paenibacillus agricola]|uniref:NUDIX hydrolase n=1 Tax=Paenibacillus agricola TaxID=2716264 RepID=A0ABX0JJD5_9BACL|nr:NUDIX hydrolase [Paenibacillus agricola]NHN34614.1 NUDIX hydrolase [Paenibacillus agricola]